MEPTQEIKQPFITFEYCKGYTLVTHLTGLEKQWRHFWNKRCLRKLYKEATKDGTTYRFTTDPRNPNNYAAIEDLVAFFKYYKESDVKPLYHYKRESGNSTNTNLLFPTK